MGYTSKYKGAEIDALLDKVEALPEGGNGGGGMEVYDLNIEIPEIYAKILLGEEMNMGIGEPPLSQSVLDAVIPSNSFVNVIINGSKLFSGVSVSSLFSGMEAVTVMRSEAIEAMSVDVGNNLEISPTFGIISIEGLGTIISPKIPYESSAKIEKLSINKQDTTNLKYAYDDNGDYCLVTINYQVREAHATATYRTTFYSSNATVDNRREFSNMKIKISFIVDSTGNITEVRSLDGAYQALEERIKALENGN